MWSSVSVTVGRPSVLLSVPSVYSSNGGQWQEILIDDYGCHSAGTSAQQQMLILSIILRADGGGSTESGFLLL